MESEMKKQNPFKEEQPEKKKKQLIRVAQRKTGNEGSYDNPTMTFALVSSPAHGRVQASAAMTCREHFNGTLWRAINKEIGNHYDPKTDPPIDTDRLRILIICTPKGITVEQFKKKLFNGKACLNLLERINGWKPSAITSVKHEKHKNAWLLTGPPEWMSQPQLLSLATWILRLAANHGPINTESYDAFEANLKKLRDTSSGGGGSSDITSYLQNFWDKLYILLKFNKEIWNHMDFEKGWCIKTDKSFGSMSGLLTFIVGKPDYSKDVMEAAAKFKKLCDQYLPRKR